MQKENEVKVH